VRTGIVAPIHRGPSCPARDTRRGASPTSALPDIPDGRRATHPPGAWRVAGRAAAGVSRSPNTSSYVTSKPSRANATSRPASAGQVTNAAVPAAAGRLEDAHAAVAEREQAQPHQGAAAVQPPLEHLRAREQVGLDRAGEAAPLHGRPRASPALRRPRCAAHGFGSSCVAGGGWGLRSAMPMLGGGAPRATVPGARSVARPRSALEPPLHDAVGRSASHSSSDPQVSSTSLRTTRWAPLADVQGPARDGSPCSRRTPRAPPRAATPGSAARRSRRRPRWRRCRAAPPHGSARGGRRRAARKGVAASPPADHATPATSNTADRHHVRVRGRPRRGGRGGRWGVVGMVAAARPTCDATVAAWQVGFGWRP
jgi:hypothetical protein